MVALVALGVGHAVLQGEEHLWLALDVGPLGAMLMVSLMQHRLTGPLVAATIVLDRHLEPETAGRETEELLEAELAPGSPTWTLGSWVVRDRFDGEAGKTPVHTSFLPVGLFPERFAGAFDCALRARVDGLRSRYGVNGTSARNEAPWMRASTPDGPRNRSVS